MSLKPRLRRLEADVQWLKYDGALRRCEIQLKILEIKKKAYARDPVRARELGLVPPERMNDPVPASPAKPTRRDAALPAVPPGEGVPVTAPPPVAQVPPPEPAPSPPSEPEQPPVQALVAVPGAVDRRWGRHLTDDDPLDDW